MVRTHSLGFSRIGNKRKLKFALEKYWKGTITEQQLQNTATDVRAENRKRHAILDFTPVGYFSLYDHVLDTSILVGNIPKRVKERGGSTLDQYFRFARGRSVDDRGDHGVAAGEMTKWFDTNYHYIVPEFNGDTEFSLQDEYYLLQIKEALRDTQNVKPVVLGPVSYLYLGKSKDGSDSLSLLEKILPIYVEFLEKISAKGIEWVQIDEPILVMELSQKWQSAFEKVYDAFSKLAAPKLLLTSYFGRLHHNKNLAVNLPVSGLHLDAVRGFQDIQNITSSFYHSDKILSLGVLDGRNVWKSDLNTLLDTLEPIHASLQDRLWIAPSCSLLHVPISLSFETNMDPVILSWLAFGEEKLQELKILAQALNSGRESVIDALQDNKRAIESRLTADRIHSITVKKAVSKITADFGKRKSAFNKRKQIQRRTLSLPLYPTTTIGSFPQTNDIRQARRAHKLQTIDDNAYREIIKNNIQDAIKRQTDIGLDVLVHGEAERNDMVEYFGEKLEGFVFSQSGWVQSYGSRYVKPPIIFGDISRPRPMTIEWSTYAKSLTKKPLKGMLTGPITILNWSFVRDDQPRHVTANQIALAIRDEVLDLERAGISIIQIDEPALREGLPLHKSEWQQYLDWAVNAFCISANGVQDNTQIHTHMCYSEFNDIIETIAKMDADVITIETSRSHMELLQVFKNFKYLNDIGPGVYDIHSPNIPSVEHMVGLIEKAEKHISAKQLWINPDCGLKTRQWIEVTPALKAMVKTAKILRQK